uniref:SUMO-conjugating enzyme UBC9 n=1 Tax=Tetraselmis chuii TaxID=63592 RepID=A0A7S1SNJ0_9CHLO|mmetsp:Transcript_21538/g.38385  ORF Transcript_21538/g.38385 Transcript_21538/m.38385 type:complete len:162 (+) Transcript_21538:306-791(+)
MLGVAKNRLAEERKCWRKDHPFGFVAKPSQAADGGVNMMEWACTIPGKEGTDWAGGRYPLKLHFSEDYPSRPPTARFPRGFFHPNVYPCGKVCLSIINEPDWRPSITIKQILLGIQDLLTNPNNDDAAQEEASNAFDKNLTKYQILVRKQAVKYTEEDIIL